MSDVDRGAVLIGHRLHINLHKDRHDRAKDLLFLLAQVIVDTWGKYDPEECSLLFTHILDMDAVKQLCQEALSTELRRGDGLRRLTRRHR